MRRWCCSNASIRASRAQASETVMERSLPAGDVWEGRCGGRIRGAGAADQPWPACGARRCGPSRARRSTRSLPVGCHLGVPDVLDRVEFEHAGKQRHRIDLRAADEERLHDVGAINLAAVLDQDHGATYLASQRPEDADQHRGGELRVRIERDVEAQAAAGAARLCRRLPQRLCHASGCAASIPAPGRVGPRSGASAVSSATCSCRGT
jgi:hypothetical protein